MKQLILITGMILALSACSSVDTKKVDKDLQKPVNCATAEGDIRVLMSEKTHTSDQIAAGVSAIVPIGLIVHSADGTEGKTMKIASGDYNKMIDKKIAEIKAQCGVE